MIIKSVHIEQIKGIENKTFNLNFIPNTPNILVASNGYGKSSFAIAFNSLGRDRLDVSDENRYKNDIDSNPVLQLTLDDGNQYKADANSNNISNIFSTIVINSQLCSKHSSKSFGGHNAVQSSISVEPITLINSIPLKHDFSYSYSNIKKEFLQAGKMLINLTDLLKNPKFVVTISQQKNNFEKLLQIKNQQKLERYTESIITLLNTKKADISILADFSEIDSIVQFIELVSNFSCFFKDIPKIELYINIIQLIETFKQNKNNNQNIIKYYAYIMEVNEFNELLPMFNCTWKNIKAKKKDGQIILEFPKANQISNGERDVLCFIGKLFEAKSRLRKSKSILIIDEIFDYLDDANLISAQYFLNKFISKFKSEGRELFPVILTHLDPLYFKTYCFSTKNVQYLEKISQITNRYNVNNLLKDRDKSKKENIHIYNHVSSNYLHYNPQPTPLQETIDYLKSLNIGQKLLAASDFQQAASLELDKYIKNIEYDVALVCCGLRIHIEKKAYDQLNQIQRIEFFDAKYYMTIDKLSYAKKCGVDIPEVHFLLSIIYNEAMHLDPQCQKLNPIAYKLKNKVIKNMICESLNAFC
ncbi:MAG: hypothetical protein ACYCWE_00085 [Eubacteriales bacterium]